VGKKANTTLGLLQEEITQLRAARQVETLTLLIKGAQEDVKCLVDILDDADLENTPYTRSVGVSYRQRWKDRGARLEKLRKTVA